MSVITVNGVNFAVGLDWLERGNIARTVWDGRKGRSAWWVNCGQQTGFGGAAGGYEAGMPAMAAALKEVIPEEEWVAVIEGEGGVFAMVLVRDGQIFANGDRLVASAAEARSQVAAARDGGWAIYSSPGVIEGAEVLGAPGLGGGAGLRPLPFAGVTARKAVGTAVLAGTMAAAGGGWLFREELLELAFGPVLTEAEVRQGEEPRISAVIDSVAMVSGCREAIRRHTPAMPGWELSALACVSRFEDGALLGVRPAMGGRPVLVVKWAMRSGGEETVLRQVAERHLALWKTARFEGELEGSVVGTQAWIAALLPPVAVEAAGLRVPGRRALRRKLDRTFGLRATRLEHGGKGGTVRVVIGEPLSRISSLVEEVPGFEVTRISHGGSGWVIEGRRARPVSMKETGFAALRRLIR